MELERLAYYKIVPPLFVKVCSNCGYNPLRPTITCAYCGSVMVTKKEYKRTSKKLRRYYKVVIKPDYQFEFPLYGTIGVNKRRKI